MTSDQTPAAPTVVTAALCVFNFSVGKMLWSRRTIFLALVPAGPVALGLLLRVMTHFGAFDGASRAINGRAINLNGPAIFGLMVWTFYLRLAATVRVCTCTVRK